VLSLTAIFVLPVVRVAAEVMTTVIAGIFKVVNVPVVPIIAPVVRLPKETAEVVFNTWLGINSKVGTANNKDITDKNNTASFFINYS
jgi:hypothetical protein